MRTASPWRHPVSGILYFRRAVPADLRSAVGRREIKISLDTKDPIEARLRFFRASLECEQLFREARLVSLEAASRARGDCRPGRLGADRRRAGADGLADA